MAANARSPSVTDSRPRGERFRSFIRQSLTGRPPSPFRGAVTLNEPDSSIPSQSRPASPVPSEVISSSTPTSNPTVEEAKATQKQKRSRAFENLMTICQGFTSLAKTIAPCLANTPFGAPVSVFIAVAEAVQTVKDTEQRASATLVSLSDRLHVISEYFGESESDDSRSMLDAYARELVRDAEKIKKIQTRSILHKAVNAEDTKSKLNEVLSQIDRELNKFHTRILLEIERNVKDIHSRLFRSDAKNWNCAPSAKFKADTIKNQPKRQACTKDTRVGIIKRIIRWAADPASPLIFWLNGMAGSGKSTIAYTVCQQLSEKNTSGARLGASFFCSRQVPDLCQLSNVVPTLAYQLARNSKSFAKSLDAVDHDLLNVSSEHVEKLLLAPWNSSIRDRSTQLPTTVIVIDALDEIENDQGVDFLRNLIEATSKLRPEETRQLKIFVTSRPHPDIVSLGAQLERDAIFRLEDIEKSYARQDILVFLTEQFPDTHKNLLERLADRSEGLFIYAATVARKLSSYSLSLQERQEELSHFLDGKQKSYTAKLGAVYDLYKQVIHEAIPIDWYRRRLPILHRIICTKQPLSIQALARMADVDSEDAVDSDAYDLLVKALHAVLYVSDLDGCVYVYHTSFTDFMLDDELSSREIACAADAQNAEMSRACLRIMQTSLQFNICNLPSSYLLDSEAPDLDATIKSNVLDVPGLEYACCYWTSHIIKVPNAYESCKLLCERLLEFMSEKVLFWIEALGLLKADESVWRGLADITAWADRQLNSSSIKLKSALMSALRLCNMFFLTATSTSTPHLYISCLAIELALHPSAPSSWKIQFPGLPQIHRTSSGHQGGVPTHINAKAVVGAVAFSPDSTRVVFGSDDRSVRIWDVLTGTQTQTLHGHTAAVMSVAFAPDGAHIVSGSGDRSVRIWDALTGMEVHKLDGHIGSVCSVAFSSNSMHIASGSGDGTVRIWRASSGEELRKLQGHRDWVNSVAFSPDGKHIVSGSDDKTVRLWDASTGAQVYELNGHTKPVNSVVFSADSTRIVSGSDDKSLRIWDASTGEEKRKLDGHTGWVYSVALSPDGTRVVSGSNDKTVRIWDALNEEQLHRLDGHTDVVRSVAFSPDGMRIVSGSEDASVRIWEEPTKHGDRLVPWIANLETGWLIRTSSNERLLWLPPDLRTGLHSESACNSELLGDKSTRVGFSNVCIGTSWTRCYRSSSRVVEQ